MGLLKTGKSLMGTLLLTPATSEYPKGGLKLPDIARGAVGIEAGTCTLCGVCARRCPAGAIRTDREDGRWMLDRMKCVTCWECIAVCPEECLAMLREYLPPDEKLVIDVYRVTPQEGSDALLETIEMPRIVPDEAERIPELPEELPKRLPDERELAAALRSRRSVQAIRGRGRGRRPGRRGRRCTGESKRNS